MIVGTSLTRRTAKFALEQQAVVAHTVRSATAGCTCSVRYALVRMRTMCRGSRHLRRHWAHPCHICAGTGLTPAYICAGTGLAPCPHLHWDWAHPAATLPT